MLRHSVAALCRKRSGCGHGLGWVPAACNLCTLIPADRTPAVSLAINQIRACSHFDRGEWTTAAGMLIMSPLCRQIFRPLTAAYAHCLSAGALFDVRRQTGQTLRAECEHSFPIFRKRGTRDGCAGGSEVGLSVSISNATMSLHFNTLTRAMWAPGVEHAPVGPLLCARVGGKRRVPKTKGLTCPRARACDPVHTCMHAHTHSRVRASRTIVQTIWPSAQLCRARAHARDVWRSNWIRSDSFMQSGVRCTLRPLARAHACSRTRVANFRASPPSPAAAPDALIGDKMVNSCDVVYHFPQQTTSICHNQRNMLAL